MIWLTWRQFRGSAAVVLGALAAMALALAVTGPQLVQLFESSGRDFLDQLERDALKRTVFVVGTALAYVVPGVIGAFWGAPMIARELEAGTHRLVWSQSITRTRWLGTKLGVGAAGAALAGSVGLLLTWWSRPIDDAVDLGYAEDGILAVPRIWPDLFGTRGVVPIAMAVLALVIGVAAGLLIRRTVAAMAATFVVVVAVQVLMPSLVQERLAAPETLTTTISNENLRGLFLTGAPGDPDPKVGGIEVAVDHPGAWVTVNHTVDSDGQVVEFLPSYAQDCADHPGADPVVVEACFERLAADGYRQRVEYHPASQFWTLQWREAGLLLVLAGLLSGFCFWRIRRDLT